MKNPNKCMYHQVHQDGASSIFPPVTSPISSPQAYQKNLYITAIYHSSSMSSKLEPTADQNVPRIPHPQELLQSLAQANLTPGLLPFLPPDFKPTTQLHVSFNNKRVSLGNLFRASECKTAPSVSFSKEVGASVLANSTGSRPHNLTCNGRTIHPLQQAQAIPSSQLTPTTPNSPSGDTGSFRD